MQASRGSSCVWTSLRHFPVFCPHRPPAPEGLGRYCHDCFTPESGWSMFASRGFLLDICLSVQSEWAAPVVSPKGRSLSPAPVHRARLDQTLKKRRDMKPARELWTLTSLGWACSSARRARDISLRIRPGCVSMVSVRGDSSCPTAAETCKRQTSFTKLRHEFAAATSHPFQYFYLGSNQ